MKRPIRDIPELDGYYVLVLEEYCDLLEQTISALRDDYSEQVKITAELRRQLCLYAERRSTGMSEQYNKNYGDNPNGTT